MMHRITQAKGNQNKLCTQQVQDTNSMAREITNLKLSLSDIGIMKDVSVFHLHINNFHFIVSPEDLSPIGALTASLRVKVGAIEDCNERGRGGGGWRWWIGRNGINDFAISNNGHQLSFDAREKTVLTLNPEKGLESETSKRATKYGGWYAPSRVFRLEISSISTFTRPPFLYFLNAECCLRTCSRIWKYRWFSSRQVFAA